MARKGPHRAVDLRPEYERLGAWLKEQRLGVGRGQRELSKSLGKPETYLSKIESGRQRMDVIEFVDLLKALGLDDQIRFADVFTAVQSGHPKA